MATMRLVYLKHQVTTYNELQILYGSNYTIYISATITSHDLIPNEQPLSKSNRRWVQLMR